MAGKLDDVLQLVRLGKGIVQATMQILQQVFCEASSDTCSIHSK